MNEILTAIAVVKGVILLLGGGITYVAYRAYRRAGDPSLGALCVGFGVITLGALLTGVANQFFSVPLETGVLVNSVFVAIGLAIIMYSLYMQR
jgi:drug/metabolite transporter (DMT)-like permease